ncbi:MAG: 2-amino-4-hydroxy-6-hydroxymethyldihydropteridine diphosphokinase [Deltaproteobacteria bacterium]|jgi:2-amino-4-hydroxy-6-hydroxymethyldihydropteridine diphosphokinase|nr:2-amino-4-hydroxy-6-hydroxymethyldihydropteridine diphosphokinase [Deltaproteobacteria bacterium]
MPTQLEPRPEGGGHPASSGAVAVHLEAGILFGANLEDPEGAIARASEAMRGIAGFRFLAGSSLWSTDPVGGPPGQPPYLNRAEIWLCPPDPILVVRELLRVEASLGRVRRERWGPRVIDIDLLYLGGLVSRDEEALVPHPRLSGRAFALYPLLEVRPGWIHPETGFSVESLVAALPSGSERTVRKLSPPAPDRKPLPIV